MIQDGATIDLIQGAHWDRDGSCSYYCPSFLDSHLDSRGDRPNLSWSKTQAKTWAENRQHCPTKGRDRRTLVGEPTMLDPWP